jgi:lysophospholipase L1-like esterase
MKPIKIIFRTIAPAAVMFTLIGAMEAAAMIPNPLISRGKTVKVSNGNAAQLVDGKFGAEVFTASANSWFAIDVGAGPTRIFISWNSMSYTWSDKIADPNRSDCKQTPSYPVNYTMQTSANSADGIDGDWTTALTVVDNKVTARGHDIDFTGMRWVKMAISSSGNANERIDEVEVFNTSNGAEDTWFFAGTSISANAFKSFPAEKTFSAYINEAHDGFYPAMIRGGIPCITSTHFARDISMYLEAAGSCRYWTIEMGTNDAWNGVTDNVAMFRKNLQLVIDSCRARHIEPIIANVLSTDSAKARWQVHPEYAKAVSDLTKSNNLIEGPDYNAAFRANPAYFNSDGVHPNNKGGAAMHKLWADKMEGLYKTEAVDNPATCKAFSGVNALPMAILSKPHHLLISIREPGTLSVFALNGRLLKRTAFQSADTFTLPRPDGCLVLQFETGSGVGMVRVIR